MSNVRLEDRLRADGMLSVKWSGTVTRLRNFGIKVEKHDDAVVSTLSIPGMVPPAKGNGTKGTRSWWAPAWAVLVSEAEPLAEEARDWALEKGALDDDFRAALEVITTFGDRKRMAEFVQELWEP